MAEKIDLFRRAARRRAARAIAHDPEVEVVFASDICAGVRQDRARRLARAGARTEAGCRGARRGGFGRASAALSRSAAPRPDRADGCRCARRVRRAGNGAGRGARGAGDGRRSEQPRAPDRGAGPRRCDRPRPRCRGGAAVDRGRPDRPRAPDRRGAAGAPPLEGSSWSRRGSRTKRRPSSTRWR